jgi:hypothetical protein
MTLYDVVCYGMHRVISHAVFIQAYRHRHNPARQPRGTIDPPVQAIIPSGSRACPCGLSAFMQEEHTLSLLSVIKCIYVGEGAPRLVHRPFKGQEEKTSTALV